MWTCSCGNDCQETDLFCSTCGQKKLFPCQPIRNGFVYGFLICRLLFALVVYFLPNLPDAVYTGLGIGITTGFIFGDALLLKKAGYNLKGWAAAGCLLFPSVYLFARAIKVDKKFAAAIISLLYEIVAILLIIALLLGIGRDFSLNPTLSSNISLQMDTKTVNSLIGDKQSFIDFDSKRNSTITSLPQINSHYIGSPIMYTVLDLDNDNTKELLVQYDMMGDTAILDIQGDNIIAYYMPGREISNLKTDGTMSWSSSAFESGVQRITFTNSGIVKNDLIVFDTALNIFTVNGISVSKENCEAALIVEYAKTDVKWLPVAQATTIVPIFSERIGQQFDTVSNKLGADGVPYITWDHPLHDGYAPKYYLSCNGTEQSYYFGNFSHLIITVRNGVVVGTATDISHRNYSTISQMFTSYGNGSWEALLEYEPQLIGVESEIYYFQWEIENAYVTVQAYPTMDSSEWATLCPQYLCVHTKE